MSVQTCVFCIDGKLTDAAIRVINELTRQNFEVLTSDKINYCNHGVIFCKKVTSECCSQLQKICLSKKIQILACYQGDSNDDIWQLLSTGVEDVLACSDFNIAADEIIVRLQRWETINSLLTPPVLNQLIGESHAFKSLMRQIVEVAYFTDTSVLIQGESGTGKEMLTKLIHDLDNRPNKGQLVILDCSTIMPELSGSEFFGHEKGAFTGAISARDGAFALADGGTLFLDEVAELPMTLQAQLLRVIQEGTFKRVGSNQWKKSSFRLVCATNLDLRQQVQRGVFRADLYYRLASFVCRMPPLSERQEDILPLANHFLQQSGNGTNKPVFDKRIQDYLLTREYPGNVRDLKQVIGRMLCRYSGQGSITVGCIPPEDRPVNHAPWPAYHHQGFEDAVHTALVRGEGLKAIGREAENTAIRLAIKANAGNLQRAAHQLGVTDRTLQIWRATQRQNDA